MAQAFRSTRVLLPDGLAPATLLVEGERVTAVLDWDDPPETAQSHDFGDFVLMPGLVDTHVHINEPGRSDWEGFETATRAAAAGGVTTLVDMPLNCIPETVSPEALRTKRNAAEGKAWVDWAAWGGVVRGNADSLLPLTQAGVRGFKCFLIDSGVDGFAGVDEAELRAALERLRGTGLPLLAHAEVAGPIKAVTEGLLSAGADWTKYSTYLASRPDRAETDAIELLIRLAEEYRAPIHIVHLSSRRALPMLSRARERGVPITVETCMHYLWFAAEEIRDGATEFKCAPPIRGAVNRDALWQALNDGLIDMVTTDHSPCPPEMRRSEDGRFDLAWGGIASLGLALPAMWQAMFRRGVDCDTACARIGRWMSAAPAALAGLTGTKGSFVAGADADIVVFDPDDMWSVETEDLQFRHKVSPYRGARLRGRVLESWLRGELVYSVGHFAEQPRGHELVRA